mmetsp:Transcript_21755/g.44672  ORF Transcript_21755/g.44672 Transcript_21755/m.44672 type:complete len:217 (-) Transcript_21755:239-889(-)
MAFKHPSAKVMAVLSSRGLAKSGHSSAVLSGMFSVVGGPEGGRLDICHRTAVSPRFRVESRITTGSSSSTSGTGAPLFCVSPPVRLAAAVDADDAAACAVFRIRLVMRMRLLRFAALILRWHIFDIFHTSRNASPMFLLGEPSNHSVLECTTCPTRFTKRSTFSCKISVVSVNLRMSQNANTAFSLVPAMNVSTALDPDRSEIPKLRWMISVPAAP